MIDLKLRLASSLLLLPILLICIYFSTNAYFQPFFVLLIAGLIGMALWEFYQISKVKGFQPPAYLAIACSTAYLFSVYLGTPAVQQLVLMGTLLLFFVYFFLYSKDCFLTLALTVFGFVYLVLTLAASLKIIYQFPDGRFFFFFVIAVTKMTDAGGYFIGRYCGKHKLAPFISPNKTWEGAIGGIAVALIAGMALASSFLDWTHAFFLSLLIGIMAQFGDLSESLLKRDAGVKDSNQLPGLGGVLDMVDSLVFTIPLMYFYLREIL